MLFTPREYRVKNHALIHDRAQHIDTMRGLALMGVIIMNIGSMVMMVNGRQIFSAASAFDITIAGLDLVFVLGKARSCFAFLFGAGFAILMMRAEAKGDAFGRFYTKRMATLLLFGLINQIFLFWGDILVTYALLGFALLLVRRWDDATFLKAGLALVLAPPVIAALLEMGLGQPLPSLLELPRAAEVARGHTAYTSPFYVDAIAQNIWRGITRHATETAHMIIYDLSVFGLFLLGAWSVRTGLLADPVRHRAILQRIVRWCVPIGIALSVVNAAPFLGMKAEGVAGAAVTAAYIGVPILAFGYLAFFAMAFTKRASVAKWLFAPAGRMSLSNYLASGAFGCWFFYGYGLGRLNDFNMTGLTLVGLGVFLVLALLSRLWLSTVPYGPAEWLWRRLSYGAHVPRGKLIAQRVA